MLNNCKEIRVPIEIIKIIVYDIILKKEIIQTLIVILYMQIKGGI